MALLVELPVYKASYELFIDIFHFAKSFTKEYKYTVGEKLKNETLEMILNIYRANVRIDKSQLLQNARENIEVIRLRKPCQRFKRWQGYYVKLYFSELTQL